VKMILAVMHDDDAEKALPMLVERKIGVTRLATTGGFLRRGNTTLMIGLADDRVEEALDTLRASLVEPELEDLRRVTVFVLPVAHFEQI
jgi:uncharacterized protein YaaQ